MVLRLRQRRLVRLQQGFGPTDIPGNAGQHTLEIAERIPQLHPALSDPCFPNRALVFAAALFDDGNSAADLAASYQRAIVKALTGRLREAQAQTGLERVAVVGGVAANSELRAALPDAAFAPLALCTDNAAMIASAARFADPVPYPDYLGLDAYA